MVFKLPADAATRPATFKQRIYLARLEKKSNEGEEMTMKEAADRIAAALSGKTKPKTGDELFEEIYKIARANGYEAGRNAIPQAMNVRDTFTGQVWHEPEGMCGFAWVNIKPGTNKFAKWLKKEGYARSDSYYGGVTIRISEHNQSVARKEADARKVAEVLNHYANEHGLNFTATAMSRLD